MGAPILIDLSAEICSDMISIPKKEHIPTNLEEVSNLKKDNIKRTMLHCSCHCGTHMDAPNHIINSSISIDKIKLRDFIGSAIKITIPTKYKREIQITNLKFSFKKCDFLILETGWHKHWGLKDYYTDYPFLGDSIIKFICSLPIKGIIIDLPSLDRPGDNSFKNHKALFRKKLIVVESAIHLNKLPSFKKFKVYAFPLKLLNSEASPCRLIADISK